MVVGELNFNLGNAQNPWREYQDSIRGKLGGGVFNRFIDYNNPSISPSSPYSVFLQANYPYLYPSQNFSLTLSTVLMVDLPVAGRATFSLRNEYEHKHVYGLGLI